MVMKMIEVATMMTMMIVLSSRFFKRAERRSALHQQLKKLSIIMIGKMLSQLKMESDSEKNVIFFQHDMPYFTLLTTNTTKIYSLMVIMTVRSQAFKDNKRGSAQSFSLYAHRLLRKLPILNGADAVIIKSQT